jgi:lysophospholipase L1-like esterase
MWIASWASSPMPATHPALPPQPDFSGRTLRQRTNLSLGGKAVRIRISNELGSKPLVIGAASVATPSGDGAAVEGPVRKLTFGGEGSIVVPAGAPAVSDPVELGVADAGELSVSLYFPFETRTDTLHFLARERGYVSEPGDQTGATEFKVSQEVASRAFLTGVEVLTADCPKVIVMFGDSITDGAWATEGANRRWPDVLAARLRAERPGSRVAVVNQGLGGNMVRMSYGMDSGLARFDRDVAAVSGVTHVVLQLGINDLNNMGLKFGGEPVLDGDNIPSTANMIQSYRQLIDRAHARGLKIIGGTLSPFAGYSDYTPKKEGMRTALNAWIRSGAFDGVADFDLALRDPADPSRLNPAYDSGDHLHPTDAGLAAMAAAVDLSLLR